MPYSDDPCDEWPIVIDGRYIHFVCCRVEHIEFFKHEMMYDRLGHAAS